MLELTNFAAVGTMCYLNNQILLLTQPPIQRWIWPEQEVELAYRVNAEVPTFLASFGIPLLHIGDIKGKGTFLVIH